MRGDHLITLEGRNVVIEALKAKRYIKTLYIESSAEGKKVDEIKQLASENAVKVVLCPRKELSKIGTTKNDQGVVALAESKKNYSVKQFLDEFNIEPEIGVVLLRSITYEQNLGAIIRTCAGANIQAIVVPKGRKSKITPLVERISMGGINDIIIIEESFYSALSIFRNNGFKSVALEVNGDRNYYEEDLTGNIVFIVGNESETLESRLTKNVDSLVRIPMNSSIPSLNVSVATAILIYERVRQQLTK